MTKVRAGMALTGLLLAVSAPVGPAQAQGLPPGLQKAWQATGMSEADLSLVVGEIGGPVLVSLRPDEPRNPASVMKTVTTWSALSTLGPDYVWRTDFLSDSGAKVDRQGTLQGPLYIRAAGDPSLTVEDLWTSLRELRLRGIKNLSRVVVDRSVFGSVQIDPGAFDDAPDRPYNASPDAMMVNFGAVRILFHADPNARQWTPIVDPPTRHVRVRGEVKWLTGRCPGSPAVGLDIQTQGREALVQVSGQAVGSCGDFSVYRLVGSQARHFSDLFQLLWRELGGTLGHGIEAGRVPAHARLLYSHQSPPLADVIRQINKYSNNVMARTLFLTLAAQQNGPGATVASGQRAVRRILVEQGVDTDGWVLDNGSGLSRHGRLTARGLSQMLTAAWQSSLMPEFASSLSIAGVDGTMRRRLRKPDTRGQAHLKTGTLQNARALAGYVHGASGKHYVLVSLANGVKSRAVRSFDDALVRWLADQ